MKILKLDTVKDFMDLTDECKEYVRDKGDGVLLVFSRHSTLGVKILENEILSLADILNWMDKYIPKDDNYMHNKIGIRNVPPDERLNAASHVRHLLLNTSEMIPVINGTLQLGVWQSIMAVELDSRREREIILSFING